MNILLTALIIAGILFFLGIVIFLIALIFKQEDEKYEDNLIINFMSNFSTPIKGHSMGLEVETKRIGNRYLIEYSPRDVNNRLMKIIKKIKNVKVVVDRNKLLILPEGTLSGYRNVKIILPPKPENFPDSMKHTLFGQKMMELTEEINGANVESRIIRVGSDRKTKLLEELGDGEISEEFIQRVKELQKELDKQKFDSRGSSTPSSSPFRPPSMPPS